ncbi:MAG: transposase [Gammaproteobacteria bacterium]|nr:transposase [Gammaproteobacteria bacterium]
MTKHTIVPLRDDGDPIQDVLREGARRLLAQAIEAEGDELINRQAERRTPEGRTGVVHNGYSPGRQLQTGIGPIDVRVTKVRAKAGEPVTFLS